MKRKKIFFIVLLITSIICIFVKNFDELFICYKIYSGEFRTSFDIQQNYNILSYEGGALISNQNGLCKINAGGKQQWKVDIKFLRPFINISGKKIMIAERGGKNLHIYHHDKLQTSIKSESPILTAKINKNGYSVVACTSDSGYKSDVVVYDKNGNDIYKWFANNGYITDVEISDDNRFIVIARVVTSKQQATANILLLDIWKNSTVSEIERDNSIISQIKFNKDGTILAMSDTELLGLTSKGTLRWNASFIGRAPFTFNTDSDNNIVVGLIDNKNCASINIYSKNGKKRGVYCCDQTVKHIATCGGKIAISRTRDVVRLYPSGKSRNLAHSDRDIKNVSIGAGGRLFMFTENYMTVVKI